MPSALDSLALAFARGVETVEKLQKQAFIDKIRHQHVDALMPIFKKYRYDKTAMVVINFEEPLTSSVIDL